MSMKKIGQVQCGTSDVSSLGYTFTDLTPYRGANYYKLAVVDNLLK